MDRPWEREGLILERGGTSLSGGPGCGGLVVENLLVVSELLKPELLKPELLQPGLLDYGKTVHVAWHRNS